MLEPSCECRDGADTAVARVGEPSIEGVDTGVVPFAGDPSAPDKVDEPADEPDECRRLSVLLDAQDRLGLFCRLCLGRLDDKLSELDGRGQLPCCWQRGNSTLQGDIAPAGGCACAVRFAWPEANTGPALPCRQSRAP